MSGRGKGGRGLSAEGRKRAKLEPYKWTPNERVAIVSHTENQCAKIYHLPYFKLHDYFRKSLLRIELHSYALKGAEGILSNVELFVNLSDEDDNEGFFEYLKKSDLRYALFPVEDGDDKDEDDEDEDGEVEDRREVLDELESWVFHTLPEWKSIPPVPVRIVVNISIYEY